MRILLTTLAAMFALSGCNPVIEPPKSLLAEGCLLNSDCAEPLVCVYRRCHQPCTSRRDCPPGSDCQLAEAPYAVCTQGDCAGKACPAGQQCGSDNECHAECVADGQCLAEQQCIAGLCVNSADADAGFLPSSCRYDSECPSSPDVFIVCRADRTCGPQCRDARDCAAGSSCSAGRCGTAAPVDAGSSCLYTSDCTQLNQVCRQGQCVPECLANRDCPVGSSCSDGRCVGATPDGGSGSACTYHSQCTQPLACVGGRCSPECQDFRDCLSGFVCQSGACLRPAIDGGTDGGTCSYNSDCPDSQRCASGICVPECRTERDCPFSFSCQNARCVPPGADGGGALDGGSVCLLNSDCRLGFRCGFLGICIPECVTARDCSTGYDCVNQRCLPAGTSADAGVPTGFGTPCNFQSTCAPYNLVCGPTGVCIYECLADRDCSTTSGFCCRTSRCVAGNQCVVPTDAGVDGGVDAGSPDAGCSADIQCLDNDFCNGTERCAAGRCAAGTSPCADNNPCTIDVCDNQARSCSYQTQAIDVDMDQHFPVLCGGSADDCDDSDPLTFPGALEGCDFKDNNCNGAVDEGLWTEEPGARGAISASGVYVPRSGPPAVRHTGTEVLVFAAADNTTGSLDAWRLGATDLSVISGPQPVEGSTSQWATCTTAATYLGKRIARPQLAVNGSQLFLTANVASFSNPQSICCAGAPNPSPETLTTRVMGVQLTAATLSMPTRSNFVSRVITAGACSSGESEVSNPQALLLDRASAAWSSHLGEWVGTWWARTIPQDPFSLRRGKITPAGVVSMDRPVYDVPGSLPAYSVANTFGFSSPRVAVGANTVIFAWPNDQQQPYAGRFLRWVIYDRNLTSVIAGPFEFGQFPNGLGTGIVGLTYPRSTR